jgi:NADH dehydrogenase
VILVTGATGFVGGHVLRRLEGEPVRAMVRDSSKASLPEGVDVVEADLTRSETLGRAMAGVETVIHAAAITANRKEPYPGAYDAINRQGTQYLVAAALGAGVKRLVVVSGLGTRPAPAGTYMATRWGLEEAVRRSGIPHVILQPSVLFGAGAEFVAALAGLVRRSPVVPVLGPGRLRFQPLWVEDLATCLVQAAADRRLDGREIPLGGSEYATMREILRTIRRAERKHRLLIPLPLGVASVQARLMVRFMAEPPLTPAALELFGFDNATDIDACERTFGFRPRGFREHVYAHGLEG